MAPKQPTNTNVLLEKVIESFEKGTQNLAEGQDKLSQKVDNLSAAYNSLAARLVHVEAKDFGTAVTKIDNTLQTLLLLRQSVDTNKEITDDLQEKLEEQRNKIEKLESKIDRIQWYINVVAFICASIIMPLFVTWVGKMITGN